jgi:hypothetical protein
MTRYKRPNKRNKTRKIKKMKGGEEPNIENQIKEFAIKTIEDKIINEIKLVGTTGTTGPTGPIGITVPTGTTGPNGPTGPKQNNKKEIAKVNYFKRLFKDDKLKDDINPIYSNFIIDKSGESVVESVAGVEELFKIFGKEYQYFKNRDDNEKILPIKTKIIENDYDPKREVPIDEINSSNRTTRSDSMV